MVMTVPAETGLLAVAEQDCAAPEDAPTVQLAIVLAAVNVFDVLVGVTDMSEKVPPFGPNE